MKQQTLPGFEHVPVWHDKDYPKEIIFFYLVSPRGDETVTMKDGEMVIVPHDLQYIIPHLFNSRNEAKRVIETGKFQGFTPKRYPYQNSWWEE